MNSIELGTVVGNSDISKKLGLKKIAKGINFNICIVENHCSVEKVYFGFEIGRDTMLNFKSIVDYVSEEIRNHENNTNCAEDLGYFEVQGISGRVSNVRFLVGDELKHIYLKKRFGKLSYKNKEDSKYFLAPDKLLRKLEFSINYFSKRFFKKPITLNSISYYVKHKEGLDKVVGDVETRVHHSNNYIGFSKSKVRGEYDLVLVVYL